MNNIGAQFCITEDGFGMTDANRVNIKPRSTSQVVVHFTNGHAMVVSPDSEFYGPEGRITVSDFNTSEPFYNIIPVIQEKFSTTEKNEDFPCRRVTPYKLGIYVARGNRALDFLYIDATPKACRERILLPTYADGRVKVYCPRSVKRYAIKTSRGERVTVLNWAKWTHEELRDYVTGYLDFNVIEKEDHFLMYYERMQAASQIWAMMAALGIPAELKVHRLSYKQNNLYNELLIPKSQALFNIPDFIYLTEEAKNWPDIKLNTNDHVFYKNTYKYVFQTRLAKFIYDTPTPPYERSK